MLFFSIIERSVFIALVFYYKDMLEKETRQRTSNFQLLLVTEKETVNATHAQLLEK